MMLAGPIKFIRTEHIPPFKEGMVFHIPNGLAQQLAIDAEGADNLLCRIVDTCAYLAEGVSNFVCVLVKGFQRLY